jgi:hypothetical protein
VDKNAFMGFFLLACNFYPECLRVQGYVFAGDLGKSKVEIKQNCRYLDLQIKKIAKMPHVLCILGVAVRRLLWFLATTKIY